MTQRVPYNGIIPLAFRLRDTPLQTIRTCRSLCRERHLQADKEPHEENEKDDGHDNPSCIVAASTLVSNAPPVNIPSRASAKMLAPLSHIQIPRIELTLHDSQDKSVP